MFLRLVLIFVNANLYRYNLPHNMAIGVLCWCMCSCLFSRQWLLRSHLPRTDTQVLFYICSAPSLLPTSTVHIMYDTEWPLVPFAGIRLFSGELCARILFHAPECRHALADCRHDTELMDDSISSTDYVSWKNRLRKHWCPKLLSMIGHWQRIATSPRLFGGGPAIAVDETHPQPEDSGHRHNMSGVLHQGYTLFRQVLQRRESSLSTVHRPVGNW